jgi:glutamine cyclotransferase
MHKNHVYDIYVYMLVRSSSTALTIIIFLSHFFCACLNHSEGLAYSNGVFYESTGLNGQSSIRTLNPLTGEKIQSYPIDSQYFGEGLTAVDDKLIQLTYQKQVGFVYDAADLTKTPDTFTFSSTLNEGWGLTYDAERKELIMSDGSHYLHFWDPHTFQELRKVPIMRQDGKNARSINELEYWRGRVLANVWYQDVILVINPATGVVEKEYGKSSQSLGKWSRHGHLSC